MGEVVRAEVGESLAAVEACGGQRERRGAGRNGGPGLGAQLVRCVGRFRDGDLLFSEVPRFPTPALSPSPVSRYRLPHRPTAKVQALLFFP
jgi:hypothetical protein